MPPRMQIYLGENADKSQRNLTSSVPSVNNLSTAKINFRIWIPVPGRLQKQQRRPTILCHKLEGNTYDGSQMGHKDHQKKGK